MGNKQERKRIEAHFQVVSASSPSDFASPIRVDMWSIFMPRPTPAGAQNRGTQYPLDICVQLFRDVQKEEYPITGYSSFFIFSML